MDNWKVIKDCSKYAVSDTGYVKNIKTGLLRAFTLNHAGYERVQLKNNQGKLVNKRVHRLVAEHYIFNEFNLKQVDHINRNRRDNNVINLRWADHITNARNQVRTKVIIHNCICKCGHDVVRVRNW